MVNDPVSANTGLGNEIVNPLLVHLTSSDSVLSLLIDSAIAATDCPSADEEYAAGSPQTSPVSVVDGGPPMYRQAAKAATSRRLEPHGKHRLFKCEESWAQAGQM